MSYLSDTFSSEEHFRIQNSSYWIRDAQEILNGQTTVIRSALNSLKPLAKGIGESIDEDPLRSLSELRVTLATLADLNKEVEKQQGEMQKACLQQLAFQLQYCSSLSKKRDAILSAFDPFLSQVRLSAEGDGLRLDLDGAADLDEESLRSLFLFVKDCGVPLSFEIRDAEACKFLEQFFEDQLLNPNVEELRFSFPIDPQATHVVAGTLKQNPGLKRLHLSFNDQAPVNQLVTVIADGLSLDQLDLRVSSWEGDVKNLEAQLLRLPGSLKSLRLEINHSSQDVFASKLPKLLEKQALLENLAVIGFALQDETLSETLLTLSTHKALKSVAFQELRLSEEGYCALPRSLGELSGLEEITYGNQTANPTIGDQIADLLEASCRSQQNLKKLSLLWNDMGMEDFFNPLMAKIIDSESSLAEVKLFPGYSNCQQWEEPLYLEAFQERGIRLRFFYGI